MAHYAFLDAGNVVTEVITGIDETNLIEGLHPEVWYGNFRGQVCKRTSYNTQGGVHYDPNTHTPSANQGKSFRKNYAGTGYTYDAGRDAFIAPQPFASWLLDEATCQWGAPVPMPVPNNPPQYVWDEANLSWAEVLL